MSGIFMWGSNQDLKQGVPGILFSMQGSILILVLWILALLSFLAGDYLSHNREKSVVSSNAWNYEKENCAVNSVIQIFSADRSPLSGLEEEKDWIKFSPGGLDVWAKSDKESGRINVNSASEVTLREKIRQIMGDERSDEAERLADAILDWRDADDLTRLYGAEAGDYQTNGLQYVPGNGPFQSLTQLLLVKGMVSNLFWGDPLASVEENADSDEQLKGPGTGSLVENFTIYGTNVRRVSMVIPRRGKSYLFVLAFLSRVNGKWQAFQVYRMTLLMSREEELNDRG
jgi:hypothetical protein